MIFAKLLSLLLLLQSLQNYYCYFCHCYCYFHITLLLNTLLQILSILSLSGVVELTTQLLILVNILWLPLCQINKFGLNTLPSKNVAIPYTCGLLDGSRIAFSQGAKEGYLGVDTTTYTYYLCYGTLLSSVAARC